MSVTAYQIAMLEGAPGFIRGAIKNGIRKGLTAAEQDRFLVLTQDEKLWQKYFEVSTDKDPYVVMIDAKGNIVWHGHGAAANLEPLLRVSLEFALRFPAREERLIFELHYPTSQNRDMGHPL